MDERDVTTLCFGCDYCLVDVTGVLCVYREQVLARGTGPEAVKALQACPQEDPIRGVTR